MNLFKKKTIFYTDIFQNQVHNRIMNFVNYGFKKFCLISK